MCWGTCMDSVCLMHLAAVTQCAGGGSIHRMCAMACTLQDGQQDEKDLNEKHTIMKTHIQSMLFTLENSPKTVQRLSAVLGR